VKKRGKEEKNRKKMGGAPPIFCILEITMGAPPHILGGPPHLKFDRGGR